MACQVTISTGTELGFLMSYTGNEGGRIFTKFLSENFQFRFYNSGHTPESIGIRLSTGSPPEGFSHSFAE